MCSWMILFTSFVIVKLCGLIMNFFAPIIVSANHHNFLVKSMIKPHFRLTFKVSAPEHMANLTTSLMMCIYRNQRRIAVELFIFRLCVLFYEGMLVYTNDTCHRIYWFAGRRISSIYRSTVFPKHFLFVIILSKVLHRWNPRDFYLHTPFIDERNVKDRNSVDSDDGIS